MAVAAMVTPVWCLRAVFFCIFGKESNVKYKQQPTSSRKSKEMVHCGNGAAGDK